MLMASYYEHCSEMSEEQFHKYMELLPIFDVSIQEILKDMLYTYTVHRHRDARKTVLSSPACTWRKAPRCSIY